MLALKISQHIARGGFLRSLYNSGSAVLSKDIQKVQQHADDLDQSIKSATDTLDLFDALAQHDKVMSSEHVMQSLKTLFTLQKSGNSSLEAAQIMNHPQFEKLCRDLRTASRSLDQKDIIQALKVLSYLGIPTNSNIMYILLNMLRRQINDLNLGNIIFLDFLLKRLEKTPLVEALQIALPMILQIQLSTQLDHENVPELVDLITYAANNKISDKCIMSIVTALTLHGENLKVENAVAIIWALSEFDNYKTAYDRLLHNCFNVVKANMNALTFNKVDNVIHKCINKYILKHNSFFDADLLNTAAEFVVNKDVGFTKAIYLVKKLNKINFVNVCLLNYIAQTLHQNPDDIASTRPLTFFNAVTAFSIANYTPQPSWDVIKPYILKNPVIRSDKVELPWMKLNLELLSIGCYDKSLIEKVFDDDFLDHHLAREQNLLDYLQMLLLYQCTQTICTEYDGKLPAKRFLDKAIELCLEKSYFPLTAFLTRIYGEENIATKILSRLGHIIDHAIIFDNGSRPVAINYNAEMTIEDLKAQGSTVVAILGCPKSQYTINEPRLKGVFHLRIKTLEALGIPVVAINLQQWSDLPEHERLPYLEREIAFKIQESSTSSEP